MDLEDSRIGLVNLDEDDFVDISTVTYFSISDGNNALEAPALKVSFLFCLRARPLDGLPYLW